MWPVVLEAPDVLLVRARGLLSADEFARCEKFRFPELRKKFALARSVLRILLGRYMGARPGELSFVYGAYGKPALVADFAGLKFNLAHSGELALYAFTRSAEVGVDIEEKKPLQDIELIASRFFAPDECRSLMGLPPEQRLDGFFNCWSRKEAFIKAVGHGLSMPLDSFSVTLARDEEAALLRWDAVGAKPERWAIHKIEVPAGYAGAVAIEDRTVTVRRRETVSAGEILREQDLS